MAGGQAPGQENASPARRKHGNRYIGAVTGETSAAASKTQTREGARYRSLSARKAVRTTQSIFLSIPTGQIVQSGHRNGQN